MTLSDADIDAALPDAVHPLRSIGLLKTVLKSMLGMITSTVTPGAVTTALATATVRATGGSADRAVPSKLADSMSGWDWGQSSTTVIGSLRAHAGGQAEQRVLCSGRSAAGDGGGGFWMWDATSTTADDGGTVIQTMGVATGRWKRVYSGPVSVLWFGAQGDVGQTTTTGSTANNTSLPVASVAGIRQGQVLRLPQGAALTTLRTRIIQIISGTQVKVALAASVAIASSNGTADSTGAATARAGTISVSGQTLTDTAASFTSANLSQYYDVPLALAPDHWTTVASVGTGTITLTVAPARASGAQTITFGTDDTSAINAALAVGGAVHAPGDRAYGVSGTIQVPTGRRLYGDGAWVYALGGSKLYKLANSNTDPVVQVNVWGGELDGLYISQEACLHPKGIVLLGQDSGSSIAQFCKLQNLVVEGCFSADPANPGVALKNGLSTYYNTLSNLTVLKCGTGFLFKGQANAQVGRNLITLACKIHMDFDGAIENALGPVGFFGSSGDANIIGAAICMRFINSAAGNVVSPFSAETSSGGVVIVEDTSSAGKQYLFGNSNEQVASSSKSWVNGAPVTANEIFWKQYSAAQPYNTLNAWGTGFFTAYFQSVTAGSKVVAVQLPAAFKGDQPFEALCRLEITLTPPGNTPITSAEYEFQFGAKQNLAGEITVVPLRSRREPTFSSWITDVFLMTGDTDNAAAAIVFQCAGGTSTLAAASVKLEFDYHVLNATAVSTISMDGATQPYATATSNQAADCVSLTVPQDDAASTREQAASGTSFTPDGSLYESFAFTLTGNATINAPVNLVPFREYTFIIIQDGTGSRTLTWNAAYTFPTAWSSTGNTAGKISVIRMVAMTATTMRPAAAQVAYA